MKTKNYITLYHYSDKKISGKLMPRYFGDNPYTFNDLKSCSIKRLFFYLERNPEISLSACQFLYTCRIDKSCLYDLKSDVKGYIKRYNTITEILSAIIKDNYRGIIYSLGSYDVACLFKSIIPTRKDLLRVIKSTSGLRYEAQKQVKA